MKCPHCKRKLKEAQIRSLWASFCASQVKSRPKIWKRHSEAAGSRCRCQDCYQKREDRKRQEEAEARERKARELPPDIPGDLSDETILGFTTFEWGPLMDRLTRDAKYRMRRRRGLNQERTQRRRRGEPKKAAYDYSRNWYTSAMAYRARREGVWGKLLEAAKRRAEKELQSEPQEEPNGSAAGERRPPGATDGQG